MKWLKALFSDNGEVSEMRVMCMLVCVVALHIAESKGPEMMPEVLGLLGIAFGGKVSQKVVEGKNGPN